VNGWVTHPTFRRTGFHYLAVHVLTPYFLKLHGSTNATSNTTDVDPVTGLGGACFGDSGGPTFDPGTGLQVAVTTAGPPTCESVNEDQRLDTASVLTFLAPFQKG
jgi:secreted trypsin-like serine protease